MFGTPGIAGSAVPMHTMINSPGGTQVQQGNPVVVKHEILNPTLVRTRSACYVSVGMASVDVTFVVGVASMWHFSWECVTMTIGYGLGDKQSSSTVARQGEGTDMSHACPCHSHVHVHLPSH